MNPEIITNNISELSIREKIQEFILKSKKVVIAVAFFNDAELIKKILESGTTVTLIVSLRPPTNYYALKDILHKYNLITLYLGPEFHSKIYAFIDQNNAIFSSIVGSSNLTSGGLDNNIETNVILHDVGSLKKIDKLLNDIQCLTTILQPDILDKYKEKYDSFIKRNPPDKLTKITKHKTTAHKLKVSKKESEYYEFWKVADKVKDLVKDISKDEYPDIPAYLVIDHFWHWIVKICDPNRLVLLKNSDDLTKANYIPILFKDYCKWDKSESGKTAPTYTESMPANSKKLQKLLSINKLKVLVENDALEIYRAFHATQSLIQRFDADKKFVTENKISSIRKSLEYLLYSNDTIDIRIHNMTSLKGEYKLNQFGPSCVQELLGWVNPTKMPIRNKKADKAIRLLGFRE